MKDRNIQEPLTDAEIRSCLEDVAGDAYYFDGEVDLLLTEVRMGITDRWRAGIQLPAVAYSGGYLDGFIRGFHNLFGIDRGMQDAAGRDDFQMFLRLGGESVIYAEAPTDGGIGDPVVSLRYDFGPEDRGWGVTAEGAVKIPMHRGTRSFLSTGHTEVGLQAAAAGRFADSAVYGSLAWVRGRGNGFLTDFETNDAWDLTLAAERTLPRGWSGVVQGTLTRGPYRGRTDCDLKQYGYQLSLGVRKRRGMAVYTLAVTENLVIHSNSPDFEVHFGIGARLGRP